MRSLTFSSRPGGHRCLKYQNVPKSRSFWAIGKPRERFQSWDIRVYFISFQLDHTVFQHKGNSNVTGGPWTDEEVLIVKEKVQYMIDFRNAIDLYRDTERFPEIVNEVYGNIWAPEDPSNKHWSNKSFWRSDMMLAPTTRKLIQVRRNTVSKKFKSSFQLAFHDCLKNIDSNGNHFGGCDGCLNWEVGWDIPKFWELRGSVWFWHFWL